MKITIKIPAAINDLYSQLDEIVEMLERLEKNYPHSIKLEKVEIILFL